MRNYQKTWNRIDRDNSWGGAALFLDRTCARAHGFDAMNEATSTLRTWAEIDLEAIRSNLRVAASLSGPDSHIMMVVKANAYGHGVEAVCQAMENEKIAFWGVANIAEAERIRKTGSQKRIFILGPSFPGEREEIAKNDWCTFISTWEEAEHFNELARSMGKKLKMHIGIDTGMGREGFLPEDLLPGVDRLLSLENLCFEGVGSHMPVGDEDPVFTEKQIKEFAHLCEALSASLPLEYRHLANSAGVAGWDIPCGNLVRPGLIVYGYNPMGGEFPVDLKQTIQLKSRVTMVNTLPPGHGVSYGRDYITEHPTRVATVGIGYADGYPRQVSGRGAEVCIRGKRCPVIGRVTMDQIMVDASSLDTVAPGDEVEIFGENISAEDLACKAGTIVWDILTGIGIRVNRVYL